MKYLLIGVIDDTPKLYWRECRNISSWEDDGRNATNPWIACPHIDARLGRRIKALTKAVYENETWNTKFLADLKASKAEYEQMVPICSSAFLPLLVKELSNWILEWRMILTDVATATDDEYLQHYSTIADTNERRYRDLKERQAKEATERKKATATKALRRPSDKHKATGYLQAVKQFGGKVERGDGEARTLFLKTFIAKTNEARLFDEAPIYADIDPIEWNPSLRTAENAITKIRKAGLISE